MHAVLYVIFVTYVQQLIIRRITTIFFLYLYTGHLILYQPPWVFKAVFEAIKRFIDPKTVSKMIFLYGDDSYGSSNDLLMRSVIGKK